MKKNIIAWTLIVAICTLHAPPSLRADAYEPETKETLVDASYSDTSELEMNSTGDDLEDEEPIGTPVQPGDNAVQKKQNKEFWKNIILASVAVVVAVVSILVVSNNNGSKAH